ncbi:MAG: NAD(P)-binding domain-containing protein [Candidatus Omnitrophica bacterium]|nr:NAD(P)-binding domain-containing protein [Candidatus Omnitrophota bacterium]
MMQEPLRIRVTKIFPARRWKVLRLITKIQEFPFYMPNVKECRVLEKKKNSSLTQWRIEIEGIPLVWKEEDVFDFKNFTIQFRATEGDLELLEGQWLLQEHEEKNTMVTFELSIKLGIPMVENIIGEVVAEKFERGFERMLQLMCEKLTMRRYKNIHNRQWSDLGGFGVIGHPYNLQHLVRYFQYFKPDFRLPSQEFLVKLFELTPSYKSYDVTNFKSKTGQLASGYFIMCPIIPDMLIISPEKVVEKVVEACRVAENLGAGIVTLGGFTSIAGEMYGKSLSSLVNVPVTTGNTLTVAFVLEGVRKAAKRMELDLSKARVTIIGGTGDIGSACARALMQEAAEVTITSRNEKNLMEAERLLAYQGKAQIKTSCDNNEAVKGADIVIAAASASNSILDFKHFKSGAIICDVGYPKNISYTACDRNDILIFSGGIASLPSDFNVGFDIGMPSHRALYGCFAEAIVLDLEQHYENFSWGKGNITRERIDLIRSMASKHGFELAPFFWGSRQLTDETLDEIKENAKEAKA